MYDRRYFREIALWILAYLVLLAITVQVVNALPADSAWRYGAVVPVCVLAVAATAVELRLLLRLDELQRSIYLEASLAALWLMLVVIVTAWFFEALAGMPRLAPVWYLVAMGAGFVLGWLNALRRYR